MMRKNVLWACTLAVVVACSDDEDGKPSPGDDAGSDGSVATMDSGPGDMDAGPSTSDSGPDVDSGSDAGGVDPAVVERGRYLVHNVAVCVDCHTPRTATGQLDEDKLLSGVECFIDVDPTDDAVGCLHTRNLTDHETGLRNRSDQEIKDMFMRGERPDGKALHPVMPYYVFGNMTEADGDAIVAYLRTLPGVDHMVPNSQEPWFPGGERPAQPAPRFPEASIPMPRSSYANQEAAMRGRYLAGNVGICLECHTESNMTPGEVPRMIDKAFQGGEAFPRVALGLPEGFPDTIFSANITPHATGIEGWSVADVVRALKMGEDPDGRPLCPPMPAGPMGPFGGLTDDDANDIGHYLLSIEGGDNMVPGECSFMPPGDGGVDDAG